MAQTGLWSFEDAIFVDTSEEQVRTIPRNCNHSIAWLIWHVARCEDITMNLLVAGSPQILQLDSWQGQMKATIRDTGNAMNEDEIIEFNRRIDIAALRAYRMAVGRRTREIAGLLQPTELKQKVDPSRLQKVRDEGAVVEAASGIIDYWGKRDIAGLLLMPATRHNLVHLNEANLIKGKMKGEES
jgi:hypothetical protein